MVKGTANSTWSVESLQTEKSVEHYRLLINEATFAGGLFFDLIKEYFLPTLDNPRNFLLIANVGNAEFLQNLRRSTLICDWQRGPAGGSRQGHVD